jgi:transposase-like protein
VIYFQELRFLRDEGSGMAKRKVRSSAGRGKDLGLFLVNKDRKAKIAELAYRGMSVAEISRTLGIGKKQCYQLYWSIYEEVDSELQKYGSLLLAKKISNLQYLKRKLDPEVESGNVKAIATRLKIEQEESKLLHLYPEEKRIEDNRVIVIGFPNAIPLQNTESNNSLLLEGYNSYTMSDTTQMENTPAASSDEDEER